MINIAINDDWYGRDMTRKYHVPKNWSTFVMHSAVFFQLPSLAGLHDGPGNEKCGAVFCQMMSK